MVLTHPADKAACGTTSVPLYDQQFATEKFPCATSCIVHSAAVDPCTGNALREADSWEYIPNTSTHTTYLVLGLGDVAVVEDLPLAQPSLYLHELERQSRSELLQSDRAASGQTTVDN